jgi:hypothetical protein
MMKTRIAMLALSFLAGVATPLAYQWQSQRDTGGVLHVMESVVIPGSEQVFDAVAWSNGELVTQPETDDDWEHVEHGALAIKEGAHLLMLPGRVRDLGQWRRYCDELKEAAKAAELAAFTRNVDQLFDAGSQVYNVCNNCHRTYLGKPLS